MHSPNLLPLEFILLTSSINPDLKSGVTNLSLLSLFPSTFHQLEIQQIPLLTWIYSVSPLLQQDFISHLNSSVVFEVFPEIFCITFKMIALKGRSDHIDQPLKIYHISKADCLPFLLTFSRLPFRIQNLLCFFPFLLSICFALCSLKKHGEKKGLRERMRKLSPSNVKQAPPNPESLSSSGLQQKEPAILDCLRLSLKVEPCPCRLLRFGEDCRSYSSL